LAAPVSGFLLIKVASAMPALVVEVGVIVVGSVPKLPSGFKKVT